MTSKQKMTGIRLSDEINYKIRYIAEKNSRKINDEFRYILKNYISEYEKEHGIIELPDSQENITNFPEKQDPFA